VVGGQKPDQQWNAEDAGQRDGVGQIHRGHGLAAGSPRLTGVHYPLPGMGNQ
jgi:hypothetical protein